MGTHCGNELLLRLQNKFLYERMEKTAMKTAR